MTSFKQGQFCWVDLSTPDLGASSAWYEKMFGWTRAEQSAEGHAPYSIFMLGEQSVAGIGQIPEEMKGKMPSVWNSYVRVESAQAVEQKALELGGQIAVPTTSVGDAGTLGYLTDPTGATVAVWEPGTHGGADLVNEPGAFCWNELQTRDVPAAKTFYRELFGWELPDADEQGYHLIKSQGRENGGMMKMDDGLAGVPPHWVVYFTVEDIAAGTQRARDLGAKVMLENAKIPNVGSFSVVADPHGASFALFAVR